MARRGVEAQCAAKAARRAALRRVVPLGKGIALPRIAMAWRGAAWPSAAKAALCLVSLGKA